MKPYDKLAPWYDRFMAFMDHEGEAEDLCRFLRESGGEHGRVLDMGAGSGAHLLPLLQAGLTVDALDRSEPMLQVLRAKLAEAGLEAGLFCGDMRDYASATRYDLIYSWGDTVHHLLGSDDLTAFLRTARTLLADGGLLAFTWREREYFDELTDIGAFYERHGEDYLLWDAELLSDDRAELRYTAFLAEGDSRFRRIEETHTVMVWRERQLLSAAAACDFVVREDIAARYFERYRQEEPFRCVLILQKR